MTLPSDESAPLPARIGGKYRPTRLIGRGGMGAVYEVEHEHTGQRLALKVIAANAGLTGGALERFRMEARAAGRIRSDHVVRITDADVAPELEKAPFLVMELLEGADLEAVTKETPPSPADVVEWLRQVARGLAKAHALGVIHRDLKPENLFLTQRDDGTPLVKILDFGVAKLIEEEGGQTRSGQLVGTPLYMAPEQAGLRDGPITPRTDGFALGLIAFKLLVGHSYWKPGSVAQLVAQATLEPMSSASERGATFGRAFDVWFARACARDANQRFDGPREQIESLAEVFGIDRVAISSASRRRASFEPRTPSLGTAQTLAASGNVVISSAESSARKTRTATAAVFGVGAVVAAALVASAVGSHGSAVVAAADGASVTSVTTTGASSIPPAPRVVSIPSASAAASVAVTTPPPTPGADAGARSDRTAPPSPRAVKPGQSPPPRRDPLEDQN